MYFSSVTNPSINMYLTITAQYIYSLKISQAITRDIFKFLLKNISGNCQMAEDINTWRLNTMGYGMKSKTNYIFTYNCSMCILNEEFTNG